MNFTFDERAADAPHVHTIWRTRSDRVQSFTSVAVSRWEIVVMHQHGRTSVGVRGPETTATRAPVPPDAEFFGIAFDHGAIVPALEPGGLVDGGVVLADVGPRSFWLAGHAWEIPRFDNADQFVRKLVREGVLVRDPVVADALRDDASHTLSDRTVRRRCVRATGLTPGVIRQIDRARQATALLQRGVPILDVVSRAGYFDPPHLTRALRRFVGHTPAEILRGGDANAMSVSYKTREFSLGY